jgi:hypothetical protein
MQRYYAGVGSCIVALVRSMEHGTVMKAEMGGTSEGTKEEVLVNPRGPSWPRSE